MRPQLTLFLVAIVSLASAQAFRAGDARAYQHVANGGFESGLAGWSMAPSAIVEITPEAFEGAASARITAGGADTTLLYPLAGALGPGAYHLSLQAKSSSEAIVWLSLQPSGAQRIEVVSTSVTPGSAWSRVEGTFTLAAGVHTSVVVRVSAATGSHVFLDDVLLDGAAPVILTPTPPPTLAPAASTAVASGTPGGPASATPTPRPTATATPASIVDVIGPSLRNVGFEEIDPDGVPIAWEKYGGTLASDGRARTGARAARLDSATAATKWLHQAVTVESGAWYAFEAWVLHDDSDVASAFLRISWYASGDGSGRAIDTVDSTASLDTLAPAYRFLTTGGVLSPPDARSARVRVLLAPVSAAPAAIIVDDVWFGASEAPPPVLATPMAPSAALASTADPSAATSRGTGVARSGRRSQAASSDFDPERVSSASSRVVINEILYDSDVADVPDADAEWVELYNAGDAPVDLTGWALLDGVGADVLPSLVVPARGFAVVAATDAFQMAHPDVDVSVIVVGGRIGNGLGNDGDRLYLIDGAGGVVDAVSWGDDASALDPAIEDVPAGHSLERFAAGVDSDNAQDFIDNERPSPGLPFEARIKPKPQSGNRGVSIIEGSGASAWDWLPWALAAGSAVACAGTLGWRTLSVVRQRTRHP